MNKKIGLEDLSQMFGCQLNDLPKQVLAMINYIDTGYREPSIVEFEEYILSVLNITNSSNVERTSKENLEAFEAGWGDNLKAISSEGISIESLKPRYFRGNKFLRYDNKLIVANNLKLEYEMFTLVRYLLFNRYLSSVENIYELGCGSCQNLFLLSEIFPEKELYGLDWSVASVRIAELISEAGKRRITGTVFDMLEPYIDNPIKPNSAVFTIHSLEQLGGNYEKLVSFIIAANPEVVLHYEPIMEFYDSNNLLDYLAICYSKRRGYLSGLYNLLLSLQEQNKIEIIEARRPYLGGVIHESSLIVWRPIPY
jgi:SAM-dependent methyltransferase